jgi:alpha-L-fucosidase
VIELKEDIRKGQRVEAFRVEASLHGKWQEIASGTTIGYKRLLKINPVETDKIRIIVSESRGKANIAETGLYLSASFNGRDF